MTAPAAIAWPEIVARALAELEKMAPSASTLHDFHARHKLLLLAVSPVHYSELGRVAARAGNGAAAAALVEYSGGFREALALPATPGRLLNALDHALGYFRDPRYVGERSAAAAAVDGFRHGTLPFPDAARALHEAAVRAGIGYLAGQALLKP